MAARTRTEDAARRPGAAAATGLRLVLPVAPWRGKGEAAAARREGAIGRRMLVDAPGRF